MEPCERVDEEDWASCEPGWLEVGKGVEPSTGEMQASLPGDGGGNGEG